MGPVKAIDARRMRSNFSGHASEYDRYAAVQKRVIRRLLARLDTSAVIAGPALDIGTGTGGLADSFQQRYPASSLVVMDIAHGMTRQASHRLDGVDACDGDARWLPFQDASFQTIISSSVYQWVANLPAAFHEVNRTLRKGGLFAVALFGEQTLCELKDSHRRAIAEDHGTRESHVQSFPGSDEVFISLGEAGFHCIELEVYPDVDFHADVPALLRQLKKIGASNASKDRPRGLSSRRVMQKMMSFYEENYRCEKGLPATYEVIMAVARKK